MLKDENLFWHNRCRSEARGVEQLQRETVAKMLVTVLILAAMVAVASFCDGTIGALIDIGVAVVLLASWVVTKQSFVRLRMAHNRFLDRWEGVQSGDPPRHATEDDRLELARDEWRSKRKAGE